MAEKDKNYRFYNFCSKANIIDSIVFALRTKFILLLIFVKKAKIKIFINFDSRAKIINLIIFVPQTKFRKKFHFGSVEPKLNFFQIFLEKQKL